MNEKQKRLKSRFDEVAYFTGCTSGVKTVIAEEVADLVSLAHELLADEPEKSLRDYTLAELAELVHDMAKEKGWWDAPREWPEIACLIHSEISEAVECYRRGEMAMHVVDGKPEGLVVELADVVIRCLDYLATLAVPSETWQRVTVTEAASRANSDSHNEMLDFLFSMHMALGCVDLDIHRRVLECVRCVFNVAKRANLDLPAAIEAKIHYNATRPYRHGGKKA